jgi:hypothetical protein
MVETSLPGTDRSIEAGYPLAGNVKVELNWPGCLSHSYPESSTASLSTRVVGKYWLMDTTSLAAAMIQPPRDLTLVHMHRIIYLVLSTTPYSTSRLLSELNKSSIMGRTQNNQTYSRYARRIMVDHLYILVLSKAP